MSGGEGMSCIEEECQRAVPGGKRKYQQDEVNVRKKVSVRRVSVRRKRLVVSRRTYCLTRELANVSYFFPFFFLSAPVPCVFRFIVSDSDIIVFYLPSYIPVFFFLFFLAAGIPRLFLT